MTTPATAGRLRVMTYNVKGLQLSRPDVVDVVRAAAPDVLGRAGAAARPPRLGAGRGGSRATWGCGPW